MKAFIEILEAGASMMRTVVQHLLAGVSREDGSLPAIFLHCTTGNNRTGVFIAMLLLLLHVPVHYVVHEYTLSEQGLAATRHLNIERLIKKGAFEEYGDAEARRKCERMVGARAESMEALVVEVKRKWEGAEGYFRDVVGLSALEISNLKDLLIAKS